MLRSHAARLAAAVVVGIGMMIVLSAPAHAATATFVKDSQWCCGYVGRMTVHNDTDTTITSWWAAFELPAGTAITSYFNAHMVREGDRYVFSNRPWNSHLSPGASISFGWVATDQGEPMNCTVIDRPCSG